MWLGAIEVVSEQTPVWFHEFMWVLTAISMLHNEFDDAATTFSHHELKTASLSRHVHFEVGKPQLEPFNRNGGVLGNLNRLW